MSKIDSLAHTSALSWVITLFMRQNSAVQLANPLNERGKGGPKPAPAV